VDDQNNKMIELFCQRATSISAQELKGYRGKTCSQQQQQQQPQHLQQQKQQQQQHVLFLKSAAAEDIATTEPAVAAAATTVAMTCEKDSPITNLEYLVEEELRKRSLVMGISSSATTTTSSQH